MTTNSNTRKKYQCTANKTICKNIKYSPPIVLSNSSFARRSRKCGRGSRHIKNTDTQARTSRADLPHSIRRALSRIRWQGCGFCNDRRSKRSTKRCRVHPSLPIHSSETIILYYQVLVASLAAARVVRAGATGIGSIGTWITSTAVVVGSGKDSEGVKHEHAELICETASAKHMLA